MSLTEPSKECDFDNYLQLQCKNVLTNRNEARAKASPIVTMTNVLKEVLSEKKKIRYCWHVTVGIRLFFSSLIGSRFTILRDHDDHSNEKESK